MELVPDSPSNVYVNFGLNNIVAKETQVEVCTLGRSLSMTTKMQSRTAGDIKTKTPLSSEVSSQRSIGTQARLKYHVWPALKKGLSSGLADGSKKARNNKVYENEPSNPALQSATSIQSSRLKQPSNQSLSAKRKVNLTDLDIGPTAAAQHEPRKDSPTIPWMFPAHGRSASAPEASASQTLFERFIQEPVTEPLILFSKEENSNDKTSPTNARLRSDSKSTTAQRTSPVESKESSHLLHNTRIIEAEEEDKPPAVPPKSPRMTNNSPNTLPHISEMHRIVPKASNSSLPPRAATAMELRPRQHADPEPHRRNESAASVPVSSKKAHKVKPSIIEIKPKHGRTETTMLHRERSKRRRSLVIAGTTKHTTTKADKITFTQLPEGFNLLDAKTLLTSSDIEKLQRQAKTQAEKFKVLQYHEAKALSRELRLLDIRYDYLRCTGKALRAGRNNFHERVIAHLRSSRSAGNSRENILGQEEALEQLNKSIDEWMSKLEQVDNRRARVRQMLLEHIAASLILTATHSQEAKRSSFASILSDGNASCASVGQESIRIYADCGVYKDADMEGLLADIEHQIKSLNGTSQSPSW